MVTRAEECDRQLPLPHYTMPGCTFARLLLPVAVDLGIIIIIIITDLYSAFRSEDTEALDAAQED